jgi:hypothetical protein
VMIDFCKSQVFKRQVAQRATPSSEKAPGALVNSLRMESEFMTAFGTWHSAFGQATSDDAEEAMPIRDRPRPHVEHPFSGCITARIHCPRKNVACIRARLPACRNGRSNKAPSDAVLAGSSPVGDI